MNTKYPLLSVESVEVAKMFRDALSSKFESRNLNFFIVKATDRLHVQLMDDVSDELYLMIYQYAQKIYREFYE